MFNDQLTAQIRQLLTTVGTIAGMLGFTGAVDGINTALAIIGPAMVCISLGWSIYANLKTSIIASAKAIPEVKGVVTTNTVEGRALANSIPGSDVAPAGSTDAKVIAATGAKP